MDGGDATRGTMPTADVRAALEEKRAELLARIAQFGANDPAETANLNFGKRIGDGTTYAVDRMNGAFQAKTLYETVTQIDWTLDRLEAGSYGRCTACGEVIPAERLAALPWAELCVPCSDRKPRQSGRA
jgi:DnaK suppressor protein